MEKYPLAPLLKVREYREDAAKNALSAAERAVVEAQEAVERCRGELERYKVWRQEEVERRYDAIMGKGLSLKELDVFKAGLGALADGDAVFVADVLENLLIIVVTGHAHTGGLDLAAKAQHGDIRGAAADINDHAAVRLGDVDAGAEGGGDGLVDQVHLTGTGGHHGLHHGIALNAGDGSGHTDSHPGLDHVGAVHLIHKPADQLPGHGVVADDAILQREDGGDIVGRASHHSQCFIAGFQHGVLAGIHCHNAGLIEHHALALLRNDDGSSTKVDADIILCHNCLNPFSAFLYHVCNARSGGQKTKTALV